MHIVSVEFFSMKAGICKNIIMLKLKKIFYFLSFFFYNFIDKEIDCGICETSYLWFGGRGP